MKIYKLANLNYSPVEGKSFEELHEELETVYLANPEYNNRDHGGMMFRQMVEKFAKDEFYNLHLVAKAYLEQQTPYNFINSPGMRNTCPSCGETGALVSDGPGETAEQYERRMQE